MHDKKSLRMVLLDGKKLADEIKLEIADNGVGMDPVIHETESSSLGLQLIKGLSQELKARLEFIHNSGTRIVVVFMHDPLMDSYHRINIPTEKEG